MRGASGHGVGPHGPCGAMGAGPAAAGGHGEWQTHRKPADAGQADHKGSWARLQAAANAAGAGEEQAQARPRSGERVRIGIERVPGQDAPASSPYGAGAAGPPGAAAAPLQVGAPRDSLGSEQGAQPGSESGAGDQSGGSAAPMRRVRGGKDVSDEAGGAQARSANCGPAKMQSIAEHAGQGAPGKVRAAEEGFGSEIPEAVGQEAAAARRGRAGAGHGAARQGGEPGSRRKPELEQGGDMGQGEDTPHGDDTPQDDDMQTDAPEAREQGGERRGEQEEGAAADGHPSHPTRPPSQPAGPRGSGVTGGRGAGAGADEEGDKADDEEQEEGRREGAPQGVACDERMTAPETPPGPLTGGSQPAQEAPPEDMTTASEVAKQAPGEGELPEVPPFTRSKRNTELDWTQHYCCPQHYCWKTWRLQARSPSRRSARARSFEVLCV